MKGFIAFINLIAATIAAPQYNYAQPNVATVYGAPTPNHHDTIITKQFFVHSAPEEQDEIGADKIINLGPGRKHYRVVFIKAPHQNVQSGRVRVIQPSNEEKTVIYVLAKKPDVSDVQADIQQAHTEPSKPDVFFIKYKTHEEAYHAQKQIQAQYDSLGGSSQISDEGVAPLSSVVGILERSASGSSGGPNNYASPATSSITGAYLPPSH